MASIFSPTALDLRPLPWQHDLTAVAAVALVALTGLALQLSAFPNHDVAWVLWGTREILAGASFGRDIIEPNPPLAWYLSAPSTWIAGLTGFPVAAAFQLAVAACGFASVLCFGRIASPQMTGKRSSLPALTAAVFLFILPGRDFGQREHLLAIAALPYLALVAVRCGGGTVSLPAATVIGVAAGLGVALKPYFLAVPLLVEATAMVLTRRWKFGLRPEIFAIAATIGVYCASILLFNGAYLVTAVPLASEIYWSFDLPLMSVIVPLALPIIAIVATTTFAERQPLPLVLAAATAGFVISCLVQHKGYSYHLYPVFAGASLALAALLSTGARAARHRLIASVLLIAVVSKPVTDTLLWWQRNGPTGTRTADVQRVVDVVNRRAAAGRFMVIAVHPYPAFPTALYARADYVSRTNSQWFLPAVVQSRATGRPHAKAERLARQFALRDLNQQPDVVIVDTDSQRHTQSGRGFDFVAFYREDPRLDAAWSNYGEAERVSTFRVFVRKQSSKS